MLLHELHHEILLNKLEKYGVRGLPLKLIRNYLTNRKQYTYINKIRTKKDNMWGPSGINSWSSAVPHLHK